MTPAQKLESLLRVYHHERMSAVTKPTIRVSDLGNLCGITDKFTLDQANKAASYYVRCCYRDIRRGRSTRRIVFQIEGSNRIL